MTAAKRADTRTILRHWREAVPEDRLAHLIKDAARALVRSLSVRLAEHKVSFGHWSFLRILWEGDGLTQRELSEQAGVMEPTTFTALKAMERLGLVERRHAAQVAVRVETHQREPAPVREARHRPNHLDDRQVGVGGGHRGHHRSRHRVFTWGSSPVLRGRPK